MRESTTDVRAYNPEDKAFLLQIVERVYDQAVRRRHEFLWEWWQKRNCLARGEHHRPTVVLRNGKVAGFMGMQPRRFKIGSEEVDGVFALDSYTDPEDRGVGLTLFRHLLRSSEVLIGGPVPRVTILWKKLFGKENIEVFHIRKGRRVVDASAFLPARSKALLGLPVRWLWHCAGAVRESMAPRLRGGMVRPVDRFPDSVDGLCGRWASSRTNAALRDADYLNWRFSDSPIAYEKRLLWQGGNLVGLAAFRIGIMNGRRVLLVVEMLAHHPDLRGAYGSMLSHILEFAGRQGVADAQTFDSGCPSLRQALQDRLFFFRAEKSALIGQFRNDKSDACPIYNIGDWFISAGDSDFEFSYFNQSYENLELARG